MTRSFSDEVQKIAPNDVYILLASFLMLYIFIWTMLSKFSMVEHRTWLSFMGLISIGLGMLTSYGICQVMDLYYSPLHKFLPFLLFGIGIDDMFVIVQAFDSLNYNHDG